MKKTKIQPGLYRLEDGSLEVRTAIRLTPSDARDTEIMNVLSSVEPNKLAATIRRMLRTGVQTGITHDSKES